MTMPEATVHETNGSETTEDQVWLSRELSVMEPISDTSRVKCPPEDKLGFRVLTADSSHHARSAFPIHYVDHQLSFSNDEQRDRSRNL